MNSIQKVYALARQAGNFNDEGKKEFQRAARAFFRRLAKDLKLDQAHYEVRANSAGPAVSGEVTLHHEAIYIQFGDVGCMFRSCKGRKDYTGGPNQWAVYHNVTLSYNQFKDALTRELVARGF